MCVQDVLEQLKCAKTTTGKSWPSPGKVPGDVARHTATRFQQVPDAVRLEMAVLSTWEIGAALWLYKLRHQSP